MKGKYVIPIALLLILASIFGTQCAFAQNDQATSTVILNYLTVSLTYPSHVTPGQLVSINVTGQAKETFELASLNVQVYLADQNVLRPLLSTTVFANTVMLSGEQINKQIQVTVPSSAPRTSLVAQVTESVGATYPYGSLGSYTYTYNPYNYPSAYPYYPYYPNYYYSYGYSPYYSTYAPYTNNYPAGSDDAITSLSYVLAPTPEYVALQSQNQQLQSQNQQLQQQLQTLKNSTAQKDSTINSLNGQLSSLQGTTIVVEIIAVILAIALVAVTTLHLKSTRTSNATAPPKAEEKTTA
jgi:hypothetical protein